MKKIFKYFAIIAAVAFQKLLDVFAVLGRLPSRQEVLKRVVTDGAVVHQPLELGEFRLVKGVALTEETEDALIPVEQYVFFFHSGVSSFHH